MKLIDSDRLKRVLNKNFGGIGGAAVLKQLIDNQPTVDAVPVVRCKNCTNRGKENQCPMMKSPDDVYYGEWEDDTEDDYFCSFGERERVDTP